MTHKLVVLSGPSGVGKDTVLQAWCAANPSVKRIVTYTTRAPRPGEVDGLDHHFVTEADFERLAREGAFIDERALFGFRYGLARVDLLPSAGGGDIRVVNIDVAGGAKVASQHPQAITIFLLPPDIDELLARLRKRGTIDPARVERARMEIDSASRYKYQITNRTLHETVAELQSLVGEEGS